MMRSRISHISKESFIPAFREAFKATFTSENIQAGFRGAGLVPYDPEVVLSKLDVRLSTPVPENSRPSTSHSWVSKTPQTAKEVAKQTTLIKNRIVRHQSSSPTPILNSVDQLHKSTERIQQELTLIKAELKRVQAANNEQSRRRHTKRQLLQEGGTLDIQEVQELDDQTAVETQISKEEGQSRRNKRQGESHSRRCGMCGGTGHNKRTCQASRATSCNSDDILG
jgi:predicted Zn-ribbon and HTH transcriptional regulator